MNKGLVVWNVDETRPLDLICVGRVAVDLYAEQIGSSLAQAQTFRKYLGGCAGNIAVGAARLGLKSALFSRVGSDAMGEFLLEQLKKECVDIRLVKTDETHLTGLVLLGVNPPDDFPLIFFRNQCADEQINIADLSDEILSQSKSLLLTGTLFAKPHLRQLAFDAIAKAKRAQCKVILDVDYRPVLWGLVSPGDGATRFVSSKEVSDVLRDVLPQCHLIVGTEEEILIASGKSLIEDATSTMRVSTEAVIVVKKGSHGCEALLPLGERIVAQPYPTKVLNVLGAGDAFMSGLLYGLFREHSIEKSLQFANACGSIVVSRHGCSPAMPNEEEMKALVEGRSISKASKSDETTVLIAAFDHRDFFENSFLENCAESQNPSVMTPERTEQISCFKKAISQSLPSYAGTLVDPIYGFEAMKTSSQKSALVGAPIEKAGAFPLEWLDSKPLYQQILERPQNWFVKVLVRLHPRMNEGLAREQIGMLQELFLCCNALERKFMLELLLPQSPECKDAHIADAMEFIYKNQVSPTWWKIEAPPTDSAWQRVRSVIQEFDCAAGIIILGKNKSFDCLREDFERVSTGATGFAVGRTLFADAWHRFKQDECSASEAGEMVARNFERCVGLWQETRSAKR